tara:strand:+ start:7471 stop:8043 length:573 start_codon:yes stop_codon:yes gene_type:complete
MMASGMAGLASLLAVACIYWSWRQRRQAVIAIVGWLLALASAVLWSRVFGPEFGVMYATITFVCLTWLAVLFGTLSASSGAAATEPRNGESRVALRPYQALARPKAADIVKHGGLFLMSVPATGLLSLMLSVALVLYLPWTLLNKIAVAIFLWPVLWGALSAWIAAQDKLARPLTVVAALFVLGGLALFI